MGFPTTLVGNAINQTVWKFANEAAIVALPVGDRHFNVRYTDGTVWYKTVLVAGVKTLVKDTDGAVLTVVQGDGVVVTRSGAEVTVAMRRSVAANNALKLVGGEAIVLEDEIDGDSQNLLQYVKDAVTGVRKLKMTAYARRGFFRSATTTVADFVANGYTAGETGNVQPGDLLMLTNSADPTNVGYTQVREAWECVGKTGTVTDFVRNETTTDVTVPARNAISTNSTFVTYNNATGKIGHLFGTETRNALKLGANGGGTVIVGDAIVSKLNGTDRKVEVYLNDLETQGNQNAQAITTLQNDLQQLSTDVDGRLDALELVSYENGVTKDGSKVKIGGQISEARTTTMAVAGSHEIVSSTANVGSMMKTTKDGIFFGNNVVFEIGKGRWWKNTTTGVAYKIDFNVETGAEEVVVNAVFPN